MYSLFQITESCALFLNSRMTDCYVELLILSLLHFLDVDIEKLNLCPIELAINFVTLLDID